MSAMDSPTPPPPTRPGVPLIERINDSRPAAAEPDSAKPVPRQRHCWVTGPPGAPGPWPGLILEWQRAPAGPWRARVTWVVDDGPEPVLVQQWLAADLVRPA